MFAAFGFLAGLGGLSAVIVLMLLALRFGKVSGKRASLAKHVAMTLSLTAGAALIMTAEGSWLTGWGSALGVVAGALCLLALGVVIADWLFDGKPDRAAFWAAFALPILLVIGLAQIPSIGSQIQGGGQQVGSSTASVTGK
jgi:hypothetical protein